MENQIAELKSQIAKLTHEVSQMKLEHVEDRVFYKALGSSVEALSNQVQNFDKQLEASYQQAEAHAKEQQTTEAAKEMTMTQITELYRTDPVAARKAMEAKGMKIGTETSANPWLFKDVTEQNRIRKIDPELADRLQAEAAAHSVTQNR